MEARDRNMNTKSFTLSTRSVDVRAGIFHDSLQSCGECEPRVEVSFGGFDYRAIGV